MNSKSKDILKRLAVGMTAEQIASEVFLSPQTVREYIRQMKTYYGAANTVHLVAIALRQKLIQ